MKEDKNIAVQPTEKAENEHDFPEDLQHENGNYICNCGKCGIKFQGHKRRLRCKKCSPTPLPEAQPLEGVKTAEEQTVKDFGKRKVFEEEANKILSDLSLDNCARKHIPLDDENFKDGYINGYIVGREKTIYTNAQFATDAGESKEPQAGERWFDTIHNEVEILKIRRDGSGIYECVKIKNGLNCIRFLKDLSYQKLSAPSTHSSSEMVDIKDVMEYFGKLRWPSKWWLTEIEKNLKSLVK